MIDARGHTGKEQVILHIDLSKGTTRRETIPESLVALFLGGRGIGDWLLWRDLPANVDPLGPENILVFSPGVLVGTNAPTAGRSTILCKSPLTGLYLKTGAGGHFGAALRRTGFDHIVVHGRSAEPTYLRIVGGETQLHNAEMVWGEGVRETNRRLQRQYGSDSEVACIGPAGENGVLFANVMLSVYHSASRGGAGAVMGAKRLKAIVIDGSVGFVTVKDPSGFIAAANEARANLSRDPMTHRLFQYGTAGDVTVFNDIRRLPSKNWQVAHIDTAEAQTLGGRSWEKAGYLKRRRGCSGCSIHCHRFTAVSDGPYAGTASGGPQLATVTRGGPNCGVGNVEAVFRFNELCNDLGLDSISTGTAISWLMESYERGAITRDETGTPLPVWGSEQALLILTERIASREGIGDLLAMGVRRASEQLGGESWKWAVQSKGMAPSGVAMQGALSYALAFAVNPRGPDHLHSETIAEYGATPQARSVIKNITGNERYAVPYLIDKRAEIVRWHEDIYAATDGLGLCAFSTTCAYGIDESLLARMFQAATGLQMSAEEIMRTGRRMMNLERCINIREGLTRTDDTLPWRIMNEQMEDLTGVDDLIPPLSQARLDVMLNDYYALHGWARDGRPSPDTLRALSLDFVFDVIAPSELSST